MADPMAHPFNPHLRAAFHPKPGAMPPSTIVIASFISLYILVFWLLTLAYMATYVNRRKSLAVSSRSVDVLLWELVVIAVTASTIGSREIFRSAHPGHGVPAMLGRFGFFLYAIVINIIHCQRMGIMIGHFDDEWRQTSSWAKHCSTAAQRGRVLAWGLVCTIGVTLIFSGNRGACVHDICRVRENLIYGADHLTLLASVALAGYPIGKMNLRMESVNAKNEVTGLYAELMMRANTNGCAWVVLQTLLMLLDFKVIQGPVWESVVNIGALVYPTAALVTNHITPSLRLGYAPTLGDLLLCCCPQRVSALALGTQRVAPIENTLGEEEEEEEEMDMEVETEDYLLMVAEEDGTEDNEELEDTQVPRAPPPPIPADTPGASLEYPVITSDTQKDASQQGGPHSPSDAKFQANAQLNESRSSRLYLQRLVSQTPGDATLKASPDLPDTPDAKAGADGPTAPPSPSDPLKPANPPSPNAGTDTPQPPPRPKIDTEASPGGPRRNFSVTGSPGTQRKRTFDGSSGHMMTGGSDTHTPTRRESRRDMPGGLSSSKATLPTSPINYCAAEEGTAIGMSTGMATAMATAMATRGSLTPTGTGMYVTTSPTGIHGSERTATSPSSLRGSLRDSVTNWVGQTAGSLRGSLNSFGSTHHGRDSATPAFSTQHEARRESTNAADRRSSTSSTGALPSALANAAANAMLAVPSTPRSYKKQTSLTPAEPRRSGRNSFSYYQEGPVTDRRTSASSSQGDRRSSASSSATQRMALTSRKSSKRLSTNSQQAERRRQRSLKQRDIFKDILRLNNEERAELFTAARLALVENPTRFVLGICELRAMPLDKANRPAVRDKCTILASAYIGDWAPSRVDIGREAEDTILKQVKKLTRRAVLFEDDCAQAIAAFEPAFEQFKTQVGQVFQSYLSVMGTDTRRFPLDNITEDQGNAAHEYARSTAPVQPSGWASMTSMLWSSMTLSKDSNAVSVGDSRHKRPHPPPPLVRDRSTSSSMSMGTMLSTAAGQEGTLNMNNSKDNSHSSSSHKDQSSGVDPSISTLPAAPSRFTTGWAGLFSTSPNTSSVIAPAPPPPSSPHGTDRSAGRHSGDNIYVYAERTV